ncbi:MAG: GIY-YIG nuclease family protein [Henriciella sp.]|uniref:GIY-YIG nuclease family protein n=1 Tax=Henriciella sp. TaxID=1968823 RepID=UPI0032ED1061
MAPRGQLLELFFIDGRPDGMLTATLLNWSGRVLVAPRTQIVDALQRPEASYTGVYILLGEQDDEPLAYIGQAENISKRINQHLPTKDWWTRAIFVCASDNKLNAAHVNYLEHKLIERAKRIDRQKLENAKVPSEPTISEADLANTETFLENILFILPAIGVELFVENTRSKKPADAGGDPSKPAPRFILQTRKHDIKATARLEGSDFIVEAGSIVRRAWESESNAQTSYSKLREELDRMGVIVPQGDHGIFKDDYAFKSPSAAAAVVNGRPTSGPSEWIHQATGKSYKEWEAAEVESEIDRMLS